MTRTTLCTVLSLTLASLSPPPSQAQTLRLLNGVGYGFAGGAVGVFATRNATCSSSGWLCFPAEMVVAAIGGTVFGTVVGVKISSSANRKVAEGKPVRGAHLGAVSVGTVLGGAMLGLMAGGLLDKEGEGTLIGSDELTFTLFALAGGGLAAWQLGRHWGELTRAGVSVQPALVEGGRLGVRAEVRF